MELIQAAFSSVNLVYTTLFCLILLYWLTVFIGFLDFSSLDIDVDVDADVEVDVDIDADIDADADTGVSSGGSVFLSFLAFFNIGKVPFMIFMSFFALFFWVIGILGNRYIGEGSVNFGLIWFLPNLFVSLLLSKFATQPLRGVFKDQENEFNTSKDILGKICIAKFPVDANSVAQAEVPSQTGGASITIKVRTNEGMTIAKGEKGLVIDYDEEKNIYILEPFFD